MEFGLVGVINLYYKDLLLRYVKRGGVSGYAIQLLEHTILIINLCLIN